ncbi:MAG: dipeptidase [Longimicrobiales bacterium]|nr:dipeptidase [Longimicrobiales bacterium]
MTDPQSYIEENLDRFREEVFDFLRIPSVSARDEHRQDMEEAATWLSEKMKAAGLESEVVSTDGHPIVLGEWKDAGPEAPTLLVYGHYDVQPPEPLDLWDSPPFEPEVREGRIYARGAADDKGQLYLHVKAFETLLEEGGGLPVNVVLLAEGEEEVGSPNLIPFVKEHRERLACDGVVISDTDMFAPDLPAILFSLRGLAYFEIRVRGPSGDLHSGTYGGSVANPANALSGILASLKNPEGRITVPGFYDDVVEWDAETLQGIEGLPFDEEGYLEEIGAPALAGEEGYTTLERRWIRPTCDVNGLLSGYTGEGAKTVLPAEAMAKVSFRLVPDQDPDRVAELFREHVGEVAPDGVEVEIEELHGGRPWRAKLEGPLYEAARKALDRAFGKEPVLTGAGGTIPIVVEFEEILRAPCLLMGFAWPGANMHAPNEWFPLENVRKGIETLTWFYREMGASAE